MPEIEHTSCREAATLAVPHQIVAASEALEKRCTIFRTAALATKIVQCVDLVLFPANTGNAAMKDHHLERQLPRYQHPPRRRCPNTCFSLET